jgi:hypothetical protein
MARLDYLLKFIILLPLLLASPTTVYSAQSVVPAHIEGGINIPETAVSTNFKSKAIAGSIAPQALTINITETARLETAVLPVDVFVEGALAYVADEEIGLRILDVTDPANPFEVGSASTPGAASSVLVSGSLALVTDARVFPDTNYGLRIFDVSTPTSPLMIGNVDTVAEVRDVIINGSLAIIAAGSSGAILIDITIPSSPIIVGTADTAGEAYSVAVSGNHLYVADGGFNMPHGVRVFNITNPALPVQVGNLDLVDDAWDIKIAGSHAYVANTYSGLRLVDVSDPMMPELIATLDTPDRALDIEISGSTAYIADFNTGLLIADISNPALPVLVNTLDTGVAQNLSLSGTDVYVADFFSGLEIVDASNLNSLVDIGGFVAPDVFASIAVDNTNLYLGDANFGLRSIDASSLDNLVLLNNQPLSSVPGFGVSDVEVDQNRAFVAEYFSVEILDVTLPQSPLFLGSFSGSFISAIDVAGNFVYAADNFEFRIIDVTNPILPLERGTLLMPGSTQSVKISGSTAIVGYGSNSSPGFDQAGLMLIDVSNPDAPVEISRVDLTGGSPTTGTIEDVAVVGNRLYALANSIGLLVYDISNPATPAELGRLETIGIFSNAKISIDGNYAYLAVSPGNGSGIDIIDISNSTSPQELGSFLTQYKTRDVEVVNNVIYLAERTGSLRIATIEFIPEMPVPDIKANGSEGPLLIAFGTPLQVEVSLVSNDVTGQAADWWLVIEAPNGRYWYDLNGSWVKSVSPIPTYGGALFDITSMAVLNRSNLPIGSYRFYFGVDTNANGVLDFDVLFADTVDVTIQ